MAVQDHRVYADVNAVVGGYLRDLALRAVVAAEYCSDTSGPRQPYPFALDTPLTDLVGPDGTWPKIPGIARPGSARVIREVLEAVDRRQLNRRSKPAAGGQTLTGAASFRRHFLSRAEVRRVLSRIFPAFAGPAIEHYLGDLQMHSEWSDGSPTVQDIADACLERGYHYSAVTDHSYGLKIAGGMSMVEAVQHSEKLSTTYQRPVRQAIQVVAGHRSEHRCRGPARSHRRRGSPPSTWSWPRRIRGYEGARIPQYSTACSPPSPTLPFVLSWRTRAVG